MKGIDSREMERALTGRYMASKTLGKQSLKKDRPEVCCPGLKLVVDRFGCNLNVLGKVSKAPTQTEINKTTGFLTFIWGMTRDNRVVKQDTAKTTESISITS